MKKEIYNFIIAIAVLSLVAALFLAYFWGEYNNNIYAIATLAMGVVFVGVSSKLISITFKEKNLAK